MAHIIRVGVSRLVGGHGLTALLTKTELTLARAISGKAIRIKEMEGVKKPAPWPYHNRGFTVFDYLYDKTSARLDDNSKVIVVEGPVAAGKSKFAKELAEELDMLYFPEANQDMIYINSYGYDLKQLDEQLPESCRSFDINNFLITPKHQNATVFQMKQYQVKVSQYVDALAHLLSTGQGVVLDRCAFSDFVFAEAMAAHGYLSKAAKKLYYEYRDNTICELMKPHLVIYLDVPVNTITQNIQKRAISYEKNSPVLTPEYLTTMEKFYKQKYLKEISRHSELLIYDWSEGGEVDIVVEDIERIEFVKAEGQGLKLKDWMNNDLEEDWAVWRNKYADRKDRIMAAFNVPAHNVPEMMIEPEDAKIYHEVMNNAPGNVYEIGYNTDLGDSSYLFKTKAPHRDTLPLRERKL